MKHQTVAFAMGAVFTLTPFAPSAASVADIETQLMHVLGQIAALKAQQSGRVVVCDLIATKASATVGEPFTLIWNSFGAKDPAEGGVVSQWARGGISSVTLNKPGNYKNTFPFTVVL